MTFRRGLTGFIAATIYIWFCLSYAIPDIEDATSPFPIQLREFIK